MRKIFLFLCIIATVAANAQSWSGDKITVKQNITLRGNRIDSLKKDTASWDGRDKTIPTVNAVYDFVIGRLAALSLAGVDSSVYATIANLLNQKNILQGNINLKLAITDTANKWVQTFYVSNDSLFGRKNNTNTFIGKLGGSGVTALYDSLEAHWTQIQYLLSTVYPEENLGTGIPLSYPRNDTLRNRTADDGNGTVADTLATGEIVFDLGGTLKKSTGINAAGFPFGISGCSLMDFQATEFVMQTGEGAQIQLIDDAAQISALSVGIFANNSNLITVESDSTRLNKRLSYTGNLHGTFGPRSVIDRSYGDSAYRSSTWIPSLQELVNNDIALDDPITLEYGAGFRLINGDWVDWRAADSITNYSRVIKNIASRTGGYYSSFEVTADSLSAKPHGGIFHLDSLNSEELSDDVMVTWNAGKKRLSRRAIPAGGGGISDGDKGDITVSSSGTVWNIDANAVGTSEIANSNVTKAKIENVAVGKVLGNNTTSAAAPVETGVWMSLTTGTASGAATIDIDLSNYYNVYDEVNISFSDLRPATNNVSIYMRVSSDGSSYNSGASDYKYQVLYGTGTGAGGLDGNTAAAQIVLGNNIGNTSTNQNNLDIKIKKPGQSTLKPTYPIRFDYINNTGVIVTTQNYALRDAAQVTRGVRILASSGNISGSYSVTGIKY